MLKCITRIYIILLDILFIFHRNALAYARVVSRWESHHEEKNPATSEDSIALFVCFAMVHSYARTR